MAERRNSERERRRRAGEQEMSYRKRPSQDRRSYEERSADRLGGESRRRASRRDERMDEQLVYEFEDEERRLSRRELRRQKEAKRRKRRRKRAKILIAEIIILFLLCVVAYGIVKLDLINYHRLDENKLEVYRDTGPYTNIALFGLDSREGELGSGVRSDCMMVASINNKTKEVKIVSLYRDTLLKQTDGTLAKANSAYARGGPQEAVALMNRNLDLDIRDYISVNFNSLADIVDILGGIEINVTEEEVPHLNNYQIETAEVVGKEAIPLERGGVQKLNGVQAVSYARIRIIGGDFQRAERQRLVLQKIVEKAQSASLITLNKLINKVLPEISTSLTKTKMLRMGANALSYKVDETVGFPFEIAGTDKIAGDNASYVIPVGIASNVTELHKFLFEKENYVPSDIVQAISSEVSELSGCYPDGQ